MVMVHHDKSTQASARSEIKAWVSRIGGMQMRDITSEHIQEAITHWSCPGKDRRGAKTVRNRFATFRLMWQQAKAWLYVAHEACQGVRLPEWEKKEQPHFSVEQVKAIIAEAKPPYDTVLWTAAETGIRRGEICGLNVGNVNLPVRMITVMRSRWGSGIKSTKSKKPRVFPLSPQLCEALCFYVEGRGSDEPLFLSKKGKRLHPDNWVKRELKPILKRLGLIGATHAFRHGNASLLDHLHVPMRVRQDRLGHVESQTTMDYTHVFGDDDRKVAAMLGEILCPNLLKNENGSGTENAQAV
jgi:integrase